MRRKLVTFFILLVMIPVIVIYLVAVLFFRENTTAHLGILYQNHVVSLGRIAETYFWEARRASLYPFLDNKIKDFYAKNPEELTEEVYQSANQALGSIPFVFSDSIRSISLIRIDGKFLSLGSNSPSAHILSEAEIKAADKLDGEPLWLWKPEQKDAIVLVRLIKNTSNFAQKLGYIKINLSLAALNKQLSRELSGLEANCYLENESYQIIMETKAFTEAELGMIHELPGQTPVLWSKDGRNLLTAYPLESAPFHLGLLASPQITGQFFPSLNISFSVITLAAFLFSIILAIAFSRIITRPLEKLGRHMRSISREDFSVRAEVKGKDEITQLAHNFNSMVVALDRLYNDVYLSEIKLKETQLLALQSQINPHFLYNTLDTIYWINQMGDNKTAAKMVSSLSQMMRLSLTPDNRNTITLAEELTHLQCYIDIQRTRFRESISFEIRCPENLKSTPVLKNLLQPLVENALTHGLGKAKKGTIIIDIFRQEERLVYEIRNDGTPLDMARIAELLAGDRRTMQGFALRNIQDRIRLKYGQNYSLHYYQEEIYAVFRVEQRWEEDD